MLPPGGGGFLGIALAAAWLAGCGTGTTRTIVVVASATPTSVPARPNPTVVPTRSTSQAAYWPEATYDPPTKLSILITRHKIWYGDSSDTPTPGDEYLALYIKIHNGDTTAHDQADTFQLIDQKHQSFTDVCDNIDIGGKYYPDLESADPLSAGQTAAGWMNCEIPKSTTTLTVKWTSVADFPAVPYATMATYRLKG